MTSIIKVDQIQLADGSTPSIGDLAINDSGTVLQVVNAVKTDKQSVSAGSWVDVSGLSVSLTPKSTSSKFILIPSVTLSIDYFACGIRLVRDGSVITEALGANVSNRTAATIAHNAYAANVGATGQYIYQMHTLSGAFQDTTSASDTTTAITFKVQSHFYTAGAINSSIDDTDNSTRYRCASSLVIYEIAG
jgi:hypothetical protein